MVSTIQSTFGGVNGTNKETNEVIRKMQGKRNAKEMVAEFFGLREEAIYDNEWEQVTGFVDDFRDMKALEQKKVQYNDKLKEIGITEEVFNAMFSNGLPTLKTKEVKDESKSDTNWGSEKQVKTGGTTKAKKK